MFHTIVNKKFTKKRTFFLVTLFYIEIRTLSSVNSLKNAELLVLTGIVGFKIGGVGLLYGWRGTGKE